MPRRLLEIAEASTLVESGQALLIAGDERSLDRLPRGRWIAGTIPYFMTEEGGVVERRRVFVESLPDGFDCLDIRRYGEEDISRVYVELPAHTMGVIILPGGTRVHMSFALNAPRYERFATAPLFGWVSGVHLAEVSTTRPKVFDGSAGAALQDEAVVMHVRIPAGRRVEVAILNIFEAGAGPAIEFPRTAFTATDAFIAGERRNFASYVREVRLDTRLPLVADYYGASVNVSFQRVEQHEVRFFAPVFAGVRYHHARPVPDYVSSFAAALPVGLGERVAFSCNCVLNYVQLALEGKKTGDIVGPMTFGEIAYQLLNQTMVYCTVHEDR